MHKVQKVSGKSVRTTNLKKQYQQPIITRRELRPSSKILFLSFYTLFCFILGSILFESEKDSTELKNLSLQIHELEKLIYHNSRSSLSPIELDKVKSEQMLNNQKISHLQNELYQVLSSSKENQKQVIREQQHEIDELKIKIHQVSQLQRYIEEDTVPSVLTLSNRNLGILRDKHRLELKRLRQKHDNLERTYIELNDMSRFEARESLRKLQDRLSMEYQIKKRDHEEERRRLYQEKILVLN